MSDDPSIPASAKFRPEASIDAPTAGAVEGELMPAADADAPPVPITAWTSNEESLALAEGMKAKSNPAEWMFDRLVRLIQDFESKLNDKEEVGAHLVQAPGDSAIHVLDVGFWGPDMILFMGKNQYGRPVRLIQHYEQVSILLTALPKETEEPPRRIGFQLREKLEKAAAEARQLELSPAQALQLFKTILDEQAP